MLRTLDVMPSSERPDAVAAPDTDETSRLPAVANGDVDPRRVVGSPRAPPAVRRATRRTPKRARNRSPGAERRPERDAPSRTPPSRSSSAEIRCCVGPAPANSAPVTAPPAVPLPPKTPKPPPPPATKSPSRRGAASNRSVHEHRRHGARAHEPVGWPAGPAGVPRRPGHRATRRRSSDASARNSRSRRCGRPPWRPSRVSPADGRGCGASPGSSATSIPGACSRWRRRSASSPMPSPSSPACCCGTWPTPPARSTTSSGAWSRRGGRCSSSTAARSSTTPGSVGCSVPWR